MTDERDFIERWDKSYISGSELLESLRRAYPGISSDAARAALDTVARGRVSPASACAAAALCELEGIGDPLETASRLYNQSAGTLTEPQWFAWIAGYSYNWICNGGLGSCYFEFDDKQFADRARVYEAIGASAAAEVLRTADQAFGADGPAPTLEGRRAATCDDLDRRLKELGPRFWACGDEIFTHVLLYALEHAEDFRTARLR